MKIVKVDKVKNDVVVNVSDTVPVDKFEQLFDELVAKCKNTLLEKNKEYSKADNRYHEFDDLAKKMSETPEKAWFHHFNKQVNAITTYCREGQLYSVNENINTRIMDAMNYLFLLYGLINRVK